MEIDYKILRKGGNVRSSLTADLQLSQNVRFVPSADAYFQGVLMIRKRTYRYWADGLQDGC